MIREFKSVLAKNEKLSIIILMFIAYVPYFLMCYKVVPVQTASDEIGAIASAAYLAGRDWSGVISYSGYYGFGWYALFWWVFKLTNSPFIIYRVVVTVSAFLRILILPIAYYIMRHYLKMKASVGTYLTAALCPFLYIITVNRITTEYMHELMTWVILLLLCKLIEYVDDNKKFGLYSILFVLANGYVLLIHTRAVMILIASVIVLFVYMFLTKRLSGKIIAEAAGIALVYLVVKRVIAYYQQWVWSLDSETGLRNSSVEVSKGINIFSAKTWQVWFDMLIGHITTEMLVTGGVFVLCTVTVVMAAITVVRSKNEWNWYYIVAIATSVMCMGATICGLMVSSWFKGMYDTWGQENINTVYSYKGMVYIRYWNVYVGPFIMCGLCLAQSYLSKLKMIIARSFTVSYAILLMFYVTFVVPIICNNSNTAGFLSGLTGYASGTPDSSFNYKAILIASCAAFIFLSLYISKHYNWGIVLIIAFMLYSEFINCTEYGDLRRTNLSKSVLASYELKCELDEEGVYIENIYLNDKTATDSTSSIYSIAQFYFNDYTLQIELPNKLNENDVIISNFEDDNILEMYPNINCYVLDGNEVWYTYLQIDK